MNKDFSRSVAFHRLCCISAWIQAKQSHSSNRSSWKKCHRLELPWNWLHKTGGWSSRQPFWQIALLRARRKLRLVPRATLNLAQLPLAPILKFQSGSKALESDVRSLKWIKVKYIHVSTILYTWVRLCTFLRTRTAPIRSQESSYETANASTRNLRQLSRILVGSIAQHIHKSISIRTVRFLSSMFSNWLSKRNLGKEKLLRLSKVG